MFFCRYSRLAKLCKQERSTTAAGHAPVFVFPVFVGLRQSLKSRGCAANDMSDDLLLHAEDYVFKVGSSLSGNDEAVRIIIVVDVRCISLK